MFSLTPLLLLSVFVKLRVYKVMDHVDQTAYAISDKIGFSETLMVPQKLDCTPRLSRANVHRIEFGNSGLSIRFLSVGNMVDFEPENTLFPYKEDVIKYSFMLSSGLFEMYSFLKDSKRIAEFDIEESMLTDVEIDTNSRLMDGLFNLLNKSDNKNLADTGKNGKTRIHLQAVKELPEGDPLIQYLNKAYTRSVGKIDVKTNN